MLQDIWQLSRLFHVGVTIPDNEHLFKVQDVTSLLWGFPLTGNFAAENCLLAPLMQQ